MTSLLPVCTGEFNRHKAHHKHTFRLDMMTTEFYICLISKDAESEHEFNTKNSFIGTLS